LIVLLSGDGKYSLEGDDLEEVLTRGRTLYSSLKDDRTDEFETRLLELREFVRKKGRPVEIFRGAEIIIPPANCSPEILRSVLGLQDQKNP